MFSNQYQSGYFVEVWDSRVNPQKNNFYKTLFKKVPSSLKNFYDKEVKSYIYELQGNSRLMLPNDDRQQLGLHQKYLVLQIFIPLGAQWSLEIGINDINGNKKRINITTNSGKQQFKYFSFRYPLQMNALQKGIWSFLAIDLYSFCNAFKNTIFRSLDHIVLHSSCKVRRIFTMKEWVQFQIPKNFWLASTIPQTLQLIEFKQSKEQTINFLGNSSIHQQKMLQSKVNQIQLSVIRNSQKFTHSNIQQEKQYKQLKLPEVNQKFKQSTPLKASKISQRQKSVSKKTNNNNQKDYNLLLLHRSNRSLTKADLIIQKSKIRLNELQFKQQQILNKLKSADESPIGIIKSQKIAKKDLKPKINSIRGDNIFKSDLYKSNLTESQSDSRIKAVGSPKIFKVKRKFEQDNIFVDQSQSQASTYSKSSNAKLINIKQKQHQSQHYQQKNKNNQQKFSSIHQSSIRMSQSRLQQSIIKKLNKQKQNKVSNQYQISSSNIKTRQQIIEEDVWTSDQDCLNRPQSPIEQMIKPINQTNQQISQKQTQINKINGNSYQTIITKQGNKQVILRKNELQQQNNQLQLIYDEMVGCYYHPITNTYYQIKGS